MHATYIISRTIFIGLFFLLLIQCNERSVQRPIPTEIAPNQIEGQSSSARKIWIEKMHRTAPTTDWRQIEYQTALKRHQNRAISREQIQTRSEWEEVIPDKYQVKWSERGSKNQAGSVFDTEYDVDRNEIWIISAGGTLFKGSAEGQQWEVVNQDLRFNTGLLKFIPLPEGRRLLAIINAIPHYSDDDGHTWTASSGLNDWRVGNKKSIVTLDDANHTMYFLSRSYQDNIAVFKSIDQGVTFDIIGNFSNSEKNILCNPINTQDVYYLRSMSDGGNILYRLESDNNLTEISRPDNFSFLDSRINLIGHNQDGALSFSLYDNADQMFSSIDGGLNFEMMGTLPTTPWSVGMYQSPSNPDFLMIGDIECYTSTDGGRNWNKVHNWWAYYDDVDGKLHADIMFFKEFMDANNNPFLLISNHGGLNVSRDQLQTVHNLSLENLNVGQFYDVVSSPALPGWIFGGSQDQGFQRGQGTDEENINMEQVISGDYGHMVFGPDESSLWIVYPFGSISVYNSAADDYSASAYYEIESDNEFTWINPTASSRIETENSIYVAGGNINGGPGSHLIKLTYNPNLFRITAEQFAYDFYDYTDDGVISSIEVSPINSDIIYIATTNGRFFRSTDRGESWDQNIDFIPQGHYLYGQKIYASRLDDQKVWLAGSGYDNPAIYVSENGGESFTAMNTGLPSTLIFDLAADADESILIAATESGPYMYLVEDNQWYDISGISTPNQTYWSVEYLEENKIARFGTYGRGIWDAKIEELIVSATTTVWPDTEIRILQNPVRDQVSLYTSFKTDQKIHISIINEKGQMIYSNKNLISAGPITHDIKLSDQQSGHYFLRVEGNQAQKSIPFILMK